MSGPKVVCDLTVGTIIPLPGVRTGRTVIVLVVSREERLIRANSKSIKKPSASGSGGVSAGSIILYRDAEYPDRKGTHALDAMKSFKEESDNINDGVPLSAARIP